MIKPAVSAKRVELIQEIQDKLKTLSDCYEKDLGDRIALARVHRKNLENAMAGLDLLKGTYRSKTDRKAG